MGFNCVIFHIRLKQSGSRTNPKKLIPLHFNLLVGKKFEYFLKKMLQSFPYRKLSSTISEPFYFGGPAVSTGGSFFYEIIQQKSQKTSLYLKKAELITPSYSRR